MNKITVSASKIYDVLVGENLLRDLAHYIETVSKSKKVAIISDTNVWPIYANIVSESLRSGGFEFCSFAFPAGEECKNGQNYLDILNFLAENQLTRTDVIIALGGGVVGDLTGFAAATYLRGISYIQVPTSLLAMVDSSVGGKTAIDLPAGKNLAGAFYQPKLVLCDITALSTLPESNFIDGCAEVIKYGVLYDSKLFHHLEEKGLNFDREHVISRCVSLKRDVVCDDEFDTGARQKLNLGHTIGHAVERNSNFQITHGQAVAIGMNIVAISAEKQGICQQGVAANIRNVLELFSLPTTTSDSADSLYTAALSDKKRTSNTINLILPVSIGDCIIKNTPINELKAFIEAGLSL